MDGYEAIWDKLPLTGFVNQTLIGLCSSCVQKLVVSVLIWLLPIPLLFTTAIGILKMIYRLVYFYFNLGNWNKHFVTQCVSNEFSGPYFPDFLL